jgi:iron complex outermembrane receptor protein
MRRRQNRLKFTPPPPIAQNADVSQNTEEIVLPGAEVRAQRETAEHVSQEQMIERGDTNLFEAMRWIPGVTTNTGHATYDSPGLGIRGLGDGGTGADYLVIMQDGTPISDLGGSSIRPDYSGMLTSGLESIDVVKGYTSVLLGPNILGGAVIMRTAKPKKPLELNARVGFDFDAYGFGGTTDTAMIGSRLGMFYARAIIQEKYVDHWGLSDDYKPGPSQDPSAGGDPQQKGKRIFTESNTFGVNIMFGINPFEELDIWATYAYSSKRLLPDGWAPPRAGCLVEDEDPSGTQNYGPATDAYILMGGAPYRNMHDATLHAEWDPGKLNLKLNGYFNFYEHRRMSLYNPSGVGWGATSKMWPLYLADSYTLSDLSSYTFGVNLQGGYEINDVHKIEGAFQIRQNNYETWGGGLGVKEEPEHTDEHLQASYKDNIYFFGVEYTINPVKAFTGIVGFGLDMNDPQKLDRWSNSNTSGVYTHTPQKSDVSNFNAMPQWSLGAFYDLTEQHEIHFTYAKKNRFPSFSQRASSVGSATTTGSNDTKPNMDLKPQQVHHFELGYRGYFLENIRITSSIYTNYEIDEISTVSLENDPDGYERQYQNIDKNLYYGFEVGTEMFLSKVLTMGGTFSIIKYKILHNETKASGGVEYEYMGNTPLFTANGYFSIAPFAGKDLGAVDNIRIMPRFEYVSTKYAATGSNLITANNRRYLDDYVLVHLGIFVDIAEHYSASFAINNLLDQLYYTNRWIPAQGRSFNISFGAKF